MDRDGRRAVRLDSSFNRQVHSADGRASRYHAGTRGEPGDGLWSDETGRVDARDVGRLRADRDCANRRPAGPWRVLHAGWRGLAEGIVASGGAGARRRAGARRDRGAGDRTVLLRGGAEMSSLYDADLTRGRKLDLWTASERALRGSRESGGSSARSLHALPPELFFSHRRDGSAGSRGSSLCRA